MAAKTKMTSEEMSAVIGAAQPGDRLELTFADKTFSGDLKGRLYAILMMAVGENAAIAFSEVSALNLRAVADTCDWQGFLTYTITVLPNFDPEYFASRTLGREMLESIRKV